MLTDPHRQRPAELRPFRAEEARSFLAATKQGPPGRAGRLLVTLGPRQGEALGLTWDDLDVDTRALRIARSLQPNNGGLTATPPKTIRSRRTLGILPSLVAAPKAHRVRQAEERLRSGGRWRESSYVFVTPIGTPLDVDIVSKSFRALRAAHGLRAVRQYDLRHAATPPMLAMRLQVVEVSAPLGHAQTPIMLNIYAHALPDADKRVSAAMGRLLSRSRRN